MKVALVLFLCSYVADSCLEPYYFPTHFDDEYTCLMEGYNQSILKMKEIGKDKVNEHSIYVKFTCMLLEEEKEETQTNHEIIYNNI